MHYYTTMTHWIRSWLRQPGARRRKAWGLALLGACAAGSRAASDAQDDTPPIEISLRADQIDGDLMDQNGTTELSGSVHLKISNMPGSYPGFTMDTERLTISLGKGEVAAPGATTFRTPAAEVVGHDLHYNYQRQDFRATDARSIITQPTGDQDLTIYARSKSIEAVGGDTSLYRTRLTTCDREHPHFAFKLRRLRMQPDKDRVTLYGGTASLYGTNIPLIHKVSGRFEDGTVKTSIILPAYSSRDGFFVPYDHMFTGPTSTARVRFDGKLTQRHALVGSLQAEYRDGPMRAWTALARQETMQDDINDRLVFNALPEVGAEYVSERGRTQITTRLTAGDYRDQNVRTHVRRHAAAVTGRVDWDWLHYEPEDSVGLWCGAGVRGSLYTTGDSYRTADVRAGISAPLWGDARGRLEVIHTFIGGTTPLEIDDVDIPTEARAAVDTPLGGPWSVALTGRLDLKESDLKDYTAEVRFQHHCLTWSLNYRDVGSQIGIGVNLFGFGSSPAEPKRARARQTVPLGPILPPLPPRSKKNEPPPTPGESVTEPEVSPTEFEQSESTRERAPDVANDPFDRRPAPSTRLAYASTVH
ncbi:MAG TPA: hypothetical protein QGH10_26460 [Armatimonadota bacterium]|nr:hypothetical protein [Armatimonadota bacterium]